MIYFDVTKTGSARYRSGLTRVSARLREELGSTVTYVNWTKWNRSVVPTDWFFTSELFSDEERPGFATWLRSRPCKMAAVFHDAIPLKFPHITWPQSVARHPSYMKMLSDFDHVFAVSDASRNELIGFWSWQGGKPRATVSTLPLGADVARLPRSPQRIDPPLPIVLCIGIVEPRKNQRFLIEVAKSLWHSGLSFELHLVGRVNPHFGPPVVAQIKKAKKEFPNRLYFHGAASDAVVAKLYSRARVTVFPTLAEGCGLPLLESLWHAVPCLCSAIPALLENASGGGCVAAPANDTDIWARELASLVTDDQRWSHLASEASQRVLTPWSRTAAIVRNTLV